MSDSSLVFEKIEREESHSFIGEGLFQKVAFFFIIVLTIEILWYGVFLPLQPFQSIQMSPLEGYSREQLLAMAGITKSSSYFNLSVPATIQALERIPEVESVTVQKQFPSSLVITIVPRHAVAILLLSVENKICPAYVDREGVIYKIKTSVQHPETTVFNLPVLSGIEFRGENPVGSRLPSALVPFLARLEVIQRSNPQLFQCLSEIRILQKAYGNYELVLYPLHYPIRVLTNLQLNEETLRYMILVLDVLTQKGVQVSEVDFRSGTVSFREKEASSGN
ncbi:MAG TPA: FtsQ-type POTRA domain-containing protein [Termitinemataceae bacterium]|nr:FtsQ-type POTRA domain-containing protein [Termitinemataceae bacterium]HOM22656.1 FtsQ-type POTRA domain-containing protein [Termitinemataceae bacterium]HPP99495.1 FtsQ-type POTRA domain-containing protein [Termitinemataceae bacterium]